ncbi:uncharacterized protein [Halyomorpha halys]|uniref:uncharacterized protein n=1 Tax=Halyomorpha halys TaxID=286706 RepID=UPI0006D5171D|nr:uncharacterized protein LOC106680650 [Halyomorpha halys]
MMKAQYLLVCVAFIPVIYAWPYKACPDLAANALKELSYRQIGGEWKIVGSKPALDDKCVNVKIDNYALTKEYYSKLFYFWYKKSSSDYTIVNEIKPTALNLKAKPWYSWKTEKLNLIGVNYDSYALFYSCTSHPFYYTESYQLWTRDEVDAANLPAGITESLALFNLKPTDLTFRTAKDCSH